MAKSVKPKLTEEASAYISECYTELRSFDTSKTDRERVYLNFNEAVDTQSTVPLIVLLVFYRSTNGVHSETLIGFQMQNQDG